MNIFIYDWLGYPIFGLNKENFKKILFFLKKLILLRFCLGQNSFMK